MDNKTMKNLFTLLFTLSSFGLFAQRPGNFSTLRVMQENGYLYANGVDLVTSSGDTISIDTLRVDVIQGLTGAILVDSTLYLGAVAADSIAATRGYVDANSGTPAGSDTEIQLNNAAAF